MDRKLSELLDELVRAQEEKLFKLGQELRPNLTREDILQPNDYPELENHPVFRYEEGALEGLKTADMALRAYFRDQSLASLH